MGKGRVEGLCRRVARREGAITDSDGINYFWRCLYARLGKRVGQGSRDTVVLSESPLCSHQPSTTVPAGKAAAPKTFYTAQGKHILDVLRVMHRVRMAIEGIDNKYIWISFCVV